MALPPLFEDDSPLADHYKRMRRLKVPKSNDDLAEAFASLSASSASASSDDKEADLIDFFLKLPEFHDLDAPSTTKKKDLKKALAFKEEGNRQFKSGQFGDALAAYTQGILCYPVDYERPESETNRDYAILLANRSACLDGPGTYAECVQDVEMAFKYGYPKNLMFKAFKRKGHALLKLKQYIDSKEAYTQCLKYIGRSDLKTKERDLIRQRTNKHMNVFGVVKQLYNRPLDEGRPQAMLPDEDKPLREEGPWTGVSNALKLNGDELQADRHILFEHALLKESPCVSVPAHSNPGHICPHTYQPMHAPVPCSFGGQIRFASERARDEANRTYHKWEWNIREGLVQLGLTPTALLALRMITMLEPGSIDPAQVPAFQLETRPPGKAGEEAFKVAFVAGFLVSQLRRVGYADVDSYPALGLQSKADRRLASLVYQAVLVSVQHGVPMTRPVYPQPRETLLDLDALPGRQYALGLFASFGRLRRHCRHDDEPDAFAFFQQNRLVLFPNRRIPQGRQLRLNLNDPTETAGGAGKATTDLNNMITFRCKNAACTLGIPLKENTQEKVIRCPVSSCQTDTSIWELLKLVRELNKSHAMLRRKFSEEGSSLADAIKGYKYLVPEWEKIVWRPYKAVSQVEREFRVLMLYNWAHEELLWMKEHS